MNSPSNFKLRRNFSEGLREASFEGRKLVDRHKTAPLNSNFKQQQKISREAMTCKPFLSTTISAAITLLLLLCHRPISFAQDLSSSPEVDSSTLELSRLSDTSSSSGSASYLVIGQDAINRRMARQDSDSSTSERDLLASAESTPFKSSFEDEFNDLNSMNQPFDYHATMPVITKRELGNAIKQATTIVKRIKENNELNTREEESDESLDNQMMGWLANSMFHKATSDIHILNQTLQALISEETTRILAKQYKLNRIQILRGLPLISVDQTNLGKFCPRSSKTYTCAPGRYRSLTGHCNNVQNPDWGSAQSALVRYAPARYIDNVSKPVKSSPKMLKQASLLPSPRAISGAIYARSEAMNPTSNVQHSHITTMMSFFGQLIFHDLSYISQYSSSVDRNAIKCCMAKPNKVHPECMQIEYKSFCLDYIRSTPAIRSGCNLGGRDQLNSVSSFLDGSVIYGSSEEQSRRLRSFQGGRLRTQRIPLSGGHIELLPQIDYSNSSSLAMDTVWQAAAEDCRLMAEMKVKAKPNNGAAQPSTNHDDRCFQAGDNRVNENIGLTLMHTIWVREHNSIADKLSQLNKHWRDEHIFEEARRLVIAELQHITYNEFLPSIIGDEIMAKFNLSILYQGYQQLYDPQLNAGISNEVATSVLPFILNTIPTLLERYSDRLEILGTTNVADTFMDGSDLFKKNKFGQYLMGMMSQNAMEPMLGLMPMTMEMESSVDRRLIKRQAANSTGSLAPNKNEAEPPQIDIVSLTIQQARDHGIKSYLYWRQVCQLKPVVKNWQDLKLVMPANMVDRLEFVYANVNQIDLYLAVLENPMPGATVGPTFVCLLARQFYHLKFGDRYWFENDFPGTAFTPKQLEQIRQTSLAKVLCRNSQATINFIQPSPMITSDPYLNAYQYCTNKAMASLDLNKWRQPVTSAQQISDELLMDDLSLEESAATSLVRGKRLADANSQLIFRSLQRAKRQLDGVAYSEMVKLRRSRRNADQQQAGFHHGSRSGSHHAAGYRFLPRMKRQTLKINNQSLIYELATNEVVRTLLRQGKDREQAKSIQNDIRDFLYSLESIQLDNLLDNSDGSGRLQEFIAMSNGGFLTKEQRTKLLQAGDQSLTADPLIEFATATSVSTASSESTRTSSVSTNCQDDDKAFPCDHTTPYRTITGWCNNLNNPKFGQSFTLHDRILPNAYEDGLAKPRQFSVILANTQNGDRLPLPSPRLISTTMHDDRSNLHVRYSLALMQFGQFGVDHDLTRTPFSVALDGSLLDCSPCNSKHTVHRDCLPIEVPQEDAFFNSQKAQQAIGTDKKCLHFVRSLNGQTGLGPRQQMNALTSYLDASNIYGSDNCEAKSLRAFVGGRLNSSQYPINQQFQIEPREILPVTTKNPECVTPQGICFHAGDQRASEQPGLTAIHTIFMRLHNTIVGQLSSMNKHWSDEKLYQEGRRIVSAIMQRITFNEFAPRLLGLDYMSKFDLILKQVGYTSPDHYDEFCSSSILNEFAAAAFRMGHSLIRNSFPLLNKSYKQIGKAFQLRKAFFNSHRILTEPNLIDSILRGIVSTPIETLDNAITEELTNHLFEEQKKPFSGMDLISLNIQRARDHGVGGYNKYRVKCNLTKAKTFDDLASEIPLKLVKKLSTLYASVDDIDLFTGGMSELPVHGGIIGPTLGCIIGLQFQRIKHCDRFWHETGDSYVRFSLPQLAEIRKMTLSRVICQESDNIDSIQRQAMDISDDYLNPRVPCSSLAAMDLSVWRENVKSCQIPGSKTRLELGQSKRVNPCKSCTCTMEGPVCRTAKINCLALLKQTANNMNSILQDKSCLVQCAWALEMQANGLTL